MLMYTQWAKVLTFYWGLGEFLELSPFCFGRHNWRLATNGAMKELDSL